MTLNLMIKPQASQQKFAFNTPEVDELFPGFTLGEFAVIYGSSALTTLTSLLCIRAQLPSQLGGLGSNVVYIDCSNTFNADRIARCAQINHLNPKTTRQRILNFSAFTAHQLTSLVTDKLEEKILSLKAKLVIVSDIAGLFLNSGIAKEEAHSIYGQIVNTLVYLAKKHQIIVIATYPTHEGSIRNIAFKEMTLSRANTVLSYFKSPYTVEVNLEKHPSYMLGTAEPPSENLTLTSFF
jgi:RecA/RadA recombinase